MRKIAVFIIISAALMTGFVTARAQNGNDDEFGNILNDTISQYGVFDGKEGVIYASREQFYYGKDMLLICYIHDDTINSAVYGVNDGAECIDTLSLKVVENGLFSVVTYDDISYLMLKNKGKGTEFFAILDDNFTHIPEITYSDKTDIAEFKKGKCSTLQNTDQTLYNFLNSLRLETIKSYPYMNKVNVINADTLSRLKEFLSACSALTEFDINNYDYDRIFKYVLYTHSAFSDVVKINPHSSLEGDIKSVSSEYIDYIMIDILGITPEHPPATDLTDRGFCYRDGVYLYTGGFTADYEIRILEIAAVHDLGAGRYHVVFSDIYREGDKSIPEYSYAIVNDRGDTFSLMRLGMGKNLLTPKQISRYASVSSISTPAWEKGEVKEIPQKSSGGAWGVVLAASAAVIAIICAAVVVMYRKKDKK